MMADRKLVSSGTIENKEIEEMFSESEKKEMAHVLIKDLYMPWL